MKKLTCLFSILLLLCIFSTGCFKKDNLEGIDIIKLNELEDEMEEKLDEIREVIVEIKEENL